MENKERLDNTIKIIYEELKKHRDEEDLKEAYDRIQKLKEKRNIK